MAITIGPGINIGGGITLGSSTPGYITSGLAMNLLTAPSSGTTWTDATGNGNNATIVTTGSGSFSYTSSYGGGITLASTLNSEAICTSYNLGTAWTVEIWGQPAATDYWATLWGNESYNAGKGWFAYWSAAAGAIAVGSPSGENTYSGIVPVPGAIKQYVFTLSSSTLTAYLNGSVQTATTSGYIAPSGGVNNTGLNFGSRHPNTGTANTPTDVCAGTFYQMRVYNTALSSSDVTTNFNAMKSNFGL